jgi:hypothetical protein
MSSVTKDDHTTLSAHAIATLLEAMSIATKQSSSVQAPVEEVHEVEEDQGEAEPVTFLPDGTIPKVRNLYEGKVDRRGRTSWTAEFPDDLEDPPENADSAQYALLIRNRKCYDGRKKLEIDSIVVQSALLKKVLGDVLKDYPGITTNLERVEFSAPFQPFVHRWERFAKAKEEETDQETLAHLELLWSVLEEELRDTIREKNDHVANGVVRFDNIWTIFEPGVLVSSVDEGNDRVFKMKSGNFMETRCGRFYSLNTEFVDFDGENFGYGTQTLNIPAFGGTQQITKLLAFPFEHHPQKEAVKDRLLARGHRFEKFKGYHYKAYDGVAIGFGCWGPIRYSVNSRIIVDTYAFNRFNPNRKVHLDFLALDTPEPESDLEYVEADDNSAKGIIPASLNEEQLLISTPSLRGYSLKGEIDCST